MTKVMTALLAIFLSLPAIAFAQNSGQQDDKSTQNKQNQAAMANEMGTNAQPRQHMSGMVSNGGQNFASDNKIYTVNNPKALKSYDNQSVAVVFQFNTDTNTIHVISVSPSQ